MHASKLVPVMWLHACKLVWCDVRTYKTRGVVVSDGLCISKCLQYRVSLDDLFLQVATPLKITVYTAVLCN